MERIEEMNLYKLFKFYNKTLFNNQLIKPRIRWFNKKGFDGLFEGESDGEYIFAQIKINENAEVHSTLIHEMVHLYQFQFNHNVNHGKSFKAWHRRIKKQMGINIK